MKTIHYFVIAAYVGLVILGLDMLKRIGVVRLVLLLLLVTVAVIGHVVAIFDKKEKTSSS